MNTLPRIKQIDRLNINKNDFTIVIYTWVYKVTCMYTCQQKKIYKLRGILTVNEPKKKKNTTKFNKNNNNFNERTTNTLNQQQDAINKTLDNTLNNVKRTTDDTTREIPRYTQRITEYQEQTIQTVRDIASEYTEAQKQVIGSFQSQVDRNSGVWDFV